MTRAAEIVRQVFSNGQPVLKRGWLLIYSVSAGVCGQRALEGRSIGQICPGTLEQLQGGFDSTLKLLLALLGGAALTRMDQ